MGRRHKRGREVGLDWIGLQGLNVPMDLLSCPGGAEVLEARLGTLERESPACKVWIHGKGSSQCVMAAMELVFPNLHDYKCSQSAKRYKKM